MFTYHLCSVLAAISENCIEMIVITLATWYLGGTFAAINSQSSKGYIMEPLSKIVLTPDNTFEPL